MTEEQAPYDVGQEPAIDRAHEHQKTLRSYFVEPEPVPEPESAHEHLYRVVFGNKIAIRFCERCGKSWLLSEVRDLVHNRSVYEWSEILEEAAARETPTSPDAQPQSRLKRYINE